MSSQNVPDSVRDSVISEILADPQNRVCFDCGSKEPKWASPYLGILVCYECAARHRSYGTHISFIRSIDLDKWKKNQIVSMKLAGNAYTKERFIQLGVPQIGGIFDYQSELIQKFRGELASKVASALESEMPEPQNKPKEQKKPKKEEHTEEIQQQENFIEEKEEPKKEEEVKEPTKFEIKQSAKVKGVKVEGKAGKKNKIKKVDFDFDFDSFNDVNFSNFNAPEEKKEEDKNDNYVYSNENKRREEEDREREEIDRTEGGYHNSYNFKVSKEEINQKFKNKKAISSEDYAALEDNGNSDRYISHKLRSMGNSQAISSSDLYGNNNDDAYYYEDSLTDKMKDLAVNFTLKAAEKAKELKNKTNEMINMVQNKFNSGY